MDLIILILATKKLSDLFSDVNKRGPYNVLSNLRYILGIRLDDMQQAYGVNDFADGILCGECNPIWIGAFLIMLPKRIRNLIALPFAIASGKEILDQHIPLKEAIDG